MTSFQLQECFEVIALCVASIYLTICICIGFYKAPKDELYRPYRQSKRMLTAALASMAINLIMWRILTTGDWSKFNYGIAILDVVLFYFEELMLCYSFCHILNNSFLTRRRITKDVTQIVIATVLVLLPLIPGLQHLTQYFFIVALIVMVSTSLNWHSSFASNISSTAKCSTTTSPTICTTLCAGPAEALHCLSFHGCLHW
ncbi:hypothetical protein [Prevotella sp.]|uniref:hypothetical protein n=1 Tax=Prevotella sp. TaxID=59823 RepID=UPI0027E38B5E|nr:hypothetical protein [Prevotella sp.]